MLYPCDLFFIFISIFIMVNCISHQKRRTSFAYFMSNYFWMIMWMKNVNNFQIAKVCPQSLAFAWFLHCSWKCCLYKKSVYLHKYGSTSYSFGKESWCGIAKCYVSLSSFLYEQLCHVFGIVRKNMTLYKVNLQWDLS